MLINAETTDGTPERVKTVAPIDSTAPMPNRAANKVAGGIDGSVGMRNLTCSEVIAIVGGPEVENEPTPD